MQKIYFMNEDHNFLPESEAVLKVIVDYDKDGHVTREVWFDLKPKKE
jgi:hypothetical protein